ncbi:hypothetical protein [Methylosoma difficile]
MKKALKAICLSFLLAGCATGPAVIRPVTVVRPAYAIPEPGYLWRMHPGFGWGWYHPRFGWYRR